MTRKEKLLKMIETDTKDPFLRFGLAMEYAKEGDKKQAIAQFDQAIILDANYCVAYYHKGKILVESGEVNEAKNVLTLGVQAARNARDSHAEGEIADLLSSLNA